ncbi:glycosyltransferase [Williamsia sterculiae]|uniref:glycosyltransferase n=1 Tax=Williamsia sterculiae TaxID=1344003 RepID=UPI0009705556|nr:glycosyltransferase [Williamsia sterculiae]
MRVSDIVVVIPAHDEAGQLGGCLASVAGAADAVAQVPVQVVVVADACTDDTVTVVPPTVRLVQIDDRNVGVARARGFAAVPSSEHTWFATTDGDSRVPADWLTTHLRHAATGVDAVIGTVEPDDWSDWPPAVARRFRDDYHARDGHRHVHGANLGVAASVYRAIGGFRGLVAHEDVDLVTRLVDHGARLEWSGGIPVRTSTRSDGRAPGGFAGYLQSLAEDEIGRPA